MTRDRNPLVWDQDQHEWIELDWTLGEHVDAIPITDEQAQRFIATGEIPKKRKGREMKLPDDSSEEGGEPE